MKMRVRSLVILACAAGAAAFGADSKSGVRIDLNSTAAPAPAPTPTTKAAPPAASTAKPAKTTAPGAAKAPAGAKQKKKDEPPPKIDGMEISRGDRGYLGVKIDGNVFKISFYDREKKPKPVDVTSAVLRWPVQYQPNDERTLLTPTSDGKALSGGKIVRPPFSFKLFITLLTEAADASGPATEPETYTVDFRQ